MIRKLLEEKILIIAGMDVPVITPKYLFEDSLYKIFSSLSFAKVSRLVDIRCIL